MSNGVAVGYKALLEAERGFRDLKTVLELRPVFVAERATGSTWNRISTELGRVHEITLTGEAGQITQTTPLAPRAGRSPPRLRHQAPTQNHHRRSSLTSTDPTAWAHTHPAGDHAFPKLKASFTLLRVPANCRSQASVCTPCRPGRRADDSARSPAVLARLTQGNRTRDLTHDGAAAPRTLQGLPH
ncbi:hypothetical protein ACH4T2_08860 [Streptomyces sioyaensis]|uniref:hypothetical protein n=1 Tax=Streptomyces sioyaensis TaxID=67364 RepID=UPI0037878253